MFFFALLGVLARILHLLLIDRNLPYMYGGLLMEFTKQIITSRFVLPVHVPFYTPGGIPFAYPPLGFYLQGIILLITGLPKFVVASLLPPVLAILAIPSIYILLLRVKSTVFSRWLAFAAFCLIPAAFQNQVQAAGLSEALGSLALIWFAFFLFQAAEQGRVSDYILLGILWAVCLLSSPGSAYLSPLLFCAFFIADQSLRKSLGSRQVYKPLIAVVIALSLSSPYWLTVIARHGIGIFLYSFLAQHTQAAGLDYLAKLASLTVPGGSILNFLILCGILVALFQRDWFLPAWFLLAFAIPREGNWLVAVPAALLVGLGGEKISQLAIAVLAKRNPLKRYDRPVQTALACLFLASLLIISFATITGDIHLHKTSALSYKALSAFRWIEASTPSDSQFIVSARSQVLEWAPQLARRTVINMRYGAEWQPSEARLIDSLDDRLANPSITLEDILGYVKKNWGIDQVYLLADKNRLHPSGRASLTILYENEEMIVGYIK